MHCGDQNNYQGSIVRDRTISKFPHTATEFIGLGYKIARARGVLAAFSPTMRLSEKRFRPTHALQRRILETQYFIALCKRIDDLWGLSEEIPDFVACFADLLAMHSLASDPHFRAAHWALTTEGAPTIVVTRPSLFAAAVRLRWRDLEALTLDSPPPDWTVYPCVTWHDLGCRLRKRYGMKAPPTATVLSLKKTNKTVFRLWTVDEFGPVDIISCDVIEALFRSDHYTPRRTTNAWTPCKAPRPKTVARGTSPTPPPGVLPPSPTPSLKRPINPTRTVTTTFVGTKETESAPDKLLDKLRVNTEDEQQTQKRQRVS